MQPGQKKSTFLFAGIGFVAVGVVSLVLIYILVYQPLTNDTASGNEEFNLEEIHSVPLARHDHVLMSILMDGQPIIISEGVGMDPKFWHDHSFDKYGPSGISPMHTHDTSGTIHIESTTQREYTVGEFLNVMGFDSGTVTKITVDGKEVSNLLDHEMKNREKIQLEIAVMGQ